MFGYTVSAMYDGGGYETDEDADYGRDRPRRRNPFQDLLPQNQFVTILVAGAIVMIFIVLLVFR